MDKALYGNFLHKAQQFSRAMNQALNKGDWDAAGLNAVHCAISANDALLVALTGVRSASTRHADSAGLLESKVSTPGVKSAVNQLKRLISKKNLIEYERRIFSKSEASNTVRDAGRFLEWVERTISAEWR